MPTMTAAQKRARAKVDYDAFLAGCPSRQLLDRISDKWVALILAALGSEGPHQPEGECVGQPRPMRRSKYLKIPDGAPYFCAQSTNGTSVAPISYVTTFHLPCCFCRRAQIQSSNVPSSILAWYGVPR